MNDLEKILDDDNTDLITMYDENNRETTFEQVAVFSLDDKIYAILKPVTKIVGVGDGEALVFVIEEIEDEDCLVIVDDEKTVDRVFDAYFEQLRIEGISAE